MSDAPDQWLDERFARLRRDEGGADWQQVARRARSASRRVAIVTAGVLAAIVLSAPAFGWHRAVLNWLDTEQATSEVQIEFARLGVSAPPEHQLGIKHEQARTVTEVTNGRKTYVLSVAPTKNGGFCFWWADLTASCRRERTPPPSYRERREGDVASFRLGTIWSPDSNGVIQSVAGNLIGSDAARLHAVYADGERVEIPVTWVSKPIDAGFYLYFTPAEHRQAGKHMTALEALNSEGGIVARQSFELTPASEIERAAELPDGETVSLPAKAIVSKAVKLIDFTASNGRQVTLWEMPTTEGGVCFVHNRGRGCPPRPLDVPLGTAIAGGSVPVLFSGQARPDVAEVVLRFEDGTEERIHPTKGYVLTEIPPANYVRGHRLTETLALDKAGNVIARHPVNPSSGGIYPCEKAVDQGFGVKMCP
jgi:hypothetical protein